VLSTRVIAQRLPDIARWVEARSLLLSGDCEVFGFEEMPELSLAVRDPSTGSVVVVGRPSPAAVHDAVREIMHDGSLVAAAEVAPWLATCPRENAYQRDEPRVQCCVQSRWTVASERRTRAGSVGHALEAILRAIAEWEERDDGQAVACRRRCASAGPQRPQ
jgi:hypothetical protein